MDILLEQDKSPNLNNNNNISLINNNNNPIKNLKDANSTIESSLSENFNNNNVNDSSPISVSPTISETIYEFGSHFENPSHVVSEKVRIIQSFISFLLTSFF